MITTKNNESLYLAYSPLKINDWMVGYVVPVHAAQESYTFITHYETLLAFFLGFIVLSLIIYLALSNSKENKYLIHLSQVDPLTSVYNKETTQVLIDQKLKTQEPCCFLILDVDAFKSVNDNFGHAVGDKVLTELGTLFKNHFRQTDIVGRIGGDEFIILIEDENIAESRIQALLKKVNELKIPELQDFVLSISVGMAYAPSQGTTFMELYRHADHALYQIKRSGKNNYNIYKSDEN